jgi:hypothetical protein
MSQQGGFLMEEDLPAGSEWALIANSLLAGGHGVMAASANIEAIFDNDEQDSLCIFPGNTEEPGLYIWMGTIEEAQAGEGGEWKRLHPSAMQYWLELP